MEPVQELPEAELDEVLGGQGAVTPCAATPDGVCICPPS